MSFLKKKNNKKKMRNVINNVFNNFNKLIENVKQNEIINTIVEIKKKIDVLPRWLKF